MHGPESVSLRDVSSVSGYLPFIIIGLVTGSVYGIASLGLVLTYKTSGVFNFGHGAIAAAAAVVFYQLHIRNGLAWPLAALIAIFAFGVIAGLILERVSAYIAEAPTAYRIVATVALILIVPAVYGIVYGPINYNITTFLPSGTAFTISEVQVGWDQVATAVLGIVAVVGLYVFFQRSKLGVLMRAVVDRPQLLDLTGYSPTRVRRIAWIIGSCFAAVSGILLVNTQQQVNVSILSLLVVQAFGAAVVGAFRSLPLAFIGGPILGVVQACSGRMIATHPSLAGLDINVPFIFLFVGLLVIKRGKLVELGQSDIRAPIRKALLNPRTRQAIMVGALIFAIIVPFVVGTKLPSWNSALAQMPLLLSLGLLVRTSGQISLCQIGFAAIGATTFAHMLSFGLPWFIALFVAGLITVPVGAIIAIPAIRLSGLFLALATLGFGILLAQFCYSKDYMFGTAALYTSRPHFLGLDSDRGFYYLLLVFALASIAYVTMIERSRMGRLLRGMADSPTALAMLGTNTNVTRVLVFCASAFLAGISGGLIASLFSSINLTPFNYVQSLVILAVLMVCGRRTVPAAILASLFLTIPTAYIDGDQVSNYTALIFGVAVIAIAMLSSGRMREALGRFATRFEDRGTGPGGSRTFAAPARAGVIPRSAATPTTRRRTAAPQL